MQQPGRLWVLGQAKGWVWTEAMDETGDLGPAGACTADLEGSVVQGKSQGLEATFLLTGWTSGRASPRCTKPALVLVTGLLETVLTAGN